MKEYENMFKYKFKKNVSNILEQLKKMEIFYIEISPIVHENSNIYFYEKKIFKNKLYSMATFNTTFNLINECLEKKKDYFTCIKCLYKKKETDLIFLQIYNKEKIEKIKKIIEQYKYEIKSEEQYIKIVIEIEEMKDGL